ncbi:hypothetical protein EV426DRAFT_587341 [Tirmania nivea]|nr:hypothetical protein EV426DRAFT_587341 [Tirmania nivea]
MAELTDTGMNFEQWIREISPSLAFYSNSRGGGFIGKRALKSVLIARATGDHGCEYYPHKFNEAWDKLLRDGFIQQLIERGKPKGVAGNSGVPSPIPPKAATVYSEQDRQISNAAAAPLVNGSDMPATESIKSPSVAELAKTAPSQFAGAVGGAGPATVPGVVTPGGSVTAETIRELAAFGGAIIKHGAQAQVNIATPQIRVKSNPPSYTSCSSSASSLAPVHSSRPSTPPAVEVSPGIPSTESLQLPSNSSSTTNRQIHPPEPAQPWKSLEVSLVDASLLRGFSPGLAVPGPTALPTLMPETTSGSTVTTLTPGYCDAPPSPGFLLSCMDGHIANPHPNSVRRAATLPVPPPQPMAYTHMQQVQQFDNALGGSPRPSLHHQSQSPQHQSQTSTVAFSPRPRPPPPPPMSIPQSQSPSATLHDHSSPHELSRQNSAMSPHVIYSPPLRLSEISLPYRVQYRILTLLISTLEFVFYDFSSKWFPEILNANFWDCAEAAEVTTWSTAILQALNSASGEVQIHASDSAENSTATRAKINRKPPPHALAHLTNLLKNVNGLYLDVSRRVFISGEKLLAHLDNSIRVSNLLGCTGRATELEEITYYVKEALGGIGMVRETVRGAFNERMEAINGKREELMRLEQQALGEASKLEREQCTKLGLDLMVTLEPKFAKVDWSFRLDRQRRNSWKEPMILSPRQLSTPSGMGSSFPPMPPARSEERLAEHQSKGKAVDKTPTPTTPIDRGRPREPRMSISKSKNPSPTTPRSDDVPPAIPAKAAKRLSNLYPPTSPILDYDTDIEHEREGPGGVGLELTLSPSGFPQTSASSVSRSRILRKDQSSLTNQGTESTDARPVTPAQVNMVREPIPQGTPVPISKLIEEEDSLEVDIRSNISTRRLGNTLLNLHTEADLPVARGNWVPAPMSRRAEKDGTSAAEKSHSAAVSSGVLNTGPTPPLTPKERKVTSVHVSQEDEALGKLFEGEHASLGWTTDERTSVAV